MSLTDPYLSIVATTRNDNHGGDLLKRTNAFLNSVYVQAERHGVSVELIVVEWNPPADKPLLEEVLVKPSKSTPVVLRVIVVPREIHETYRFAKSLPLYQMTAKNVGIRRARGLFVLCTNIDVLFTDECFVRLSRKDLKRNAFYRANRVDVPRETIQLQDFDQQLQFAKNNQIKRLGNTPGREAIKGPQFLLDRPKLARLANTMLMWLWRKTHKGQFAHFIIDFMACGDFTLMSKEDWMRIDGYVELDMYSIHIDSMGLWSACALGMEQVNFEFDECIYHIDHDNGWESDDVIKTIKFLSDKPSLDYSIVHRAGMKMVAEGKNWGLNKPDWGWANENFEEYIFQGKLA